MGKLHANGTINTYDDVDSSSIFLDTAMWGDLTPNDNVLMLSIDGAQLYQSK